MNSGADGIFAAAPIFRNFMDKMIGDKKYTFEKPEGIKDFTVDKLSGKIPTDQSPDKVTDIFASWQIPKENDDTHVKIKICKACEGDKLADENCPQSQVEEKTYTNLHSEMPDNPNWENPVIAFAKGMGISIGYPPKDVCDVSNMKPSVNITNPGNNATVSGNFSIDADANSGFGIRYVEFYIDNAKVATANSYPYSTNYNANNLSTGQHELMAKVIDNKDFNTTNTIKINVVKDTTPPGNITGVSLTPVAGGMKISWTNPSDADLYSVRIYVSTTSGNLGTKNTELPVSPNTSSQTTITGLTSGTKYYFTLRPVDTSSNENTSTTQYNDKPL
jgi:hypothetical protein